MGVGYSVTLGAFYLRVADTHLGPTLGDALATDATEFGIMTYHAHLGSSAKLQSDKRGGLNRLISAFLQSMHDSKLTILTGMRIGSHPG